MTARCVLSLRITIAFAMIDTIGYIAAFFTTFAMLPQALHVYRTNEVEQLSLRTFSMATIGAVIWIVYGILISNQVILFANLIGLCLVGYICWKKLRGSKASSDF